MALIRFPGLIDIHVHLRDPGATQKEDFLTGSKAAVAGGFTFILDMPNNPVPTFSIEAFQEKIQLSQKAVGEIGFHYGTNGKNLDTFSTAAKNPRVFGLKLYCNHTTGNFLIDDPKIIEEVLKSWQSDKPILLHAEGPTLEMVLKLGAKYNKRMHVCHISLPSEVALVRKAKRDGRQITAGICPHHLFLTDKDGEKLASFAFMKPPLGGKQNQNVLWEGLLDGTIDLVETDHAPHTIAEKKADPPAFGIPGLETALGLLLIAVHAKRLTLDQVKKFSYDNPKRIFSIPEQKKTYIEFDPDKPYEFSAKESQSKCKWSPFDGWQLYGKVETVVIRGKTLLKAGKLLNLKNS